MLLLIYINVSITSPSQDFERQIKQWCKEAGEDVTYEFAQVSVLPLSRKSAVAWFCLSKKAELISHIL